MKTKTKKRVMLTLALAIIMTCAMSITALAATKVTGLRQTGATTGGFNIAWDGVLDASRYQVYVSDNSGMTNAVVASTTSTTSTYVYSNISVGRTYYVQVVAQKYVSGVYQTLGTSDVLAVITKPESVSKVTQTKASAKGVTLTWTKATGATAYNIYRDNKKVATVTGTTATIKQTVGTYKWYYVYPVRKVGNSSVEGGYASAAAYAVPCKPLKVGASANVNWNPRDNSVELCATVNSKDKTVDGFQFAIYSVNGKKKLKTITTTSTSRYNPAKFTLKAVKNKGFQVMARGYTTINGKKCWGAWSAKKVVIPQPKVSAELDGSHAAKIKWAKVSGATKYVVYVAKNQSSSYNLASSKFKKVATVNSKTTSYKITGLKTNKYVCAYVVPVVKVGKKSYKGLSDYYWSWYYYTYYVN